jgi:hypothetical protein
MQFCQQTEDVISVLFHATRVSISWQVITLANPVSKQPYNKKAKLISQPSFCATQNLIVSQKKKYQGISLQSDVSQRIIEFSN